MIRRRKVKNFIFLILLAITTSCASRNSLHLLDDNNRYYSSSGSFSFEVPNVSTSLQIEEVRADEFTHIVIMSDEEGNINRIETSIVPNDIKIAMDEKLDRNSILRDLFNDCFLKQVNKSEATKVLVEKNENIDGVGNLYYSFIEFPNHMIMNSYGIGILKKGCLLSFCNNHLVFITMQVTPEFAGSCSGTEDLNSKVYNTLLNTRKSYEVSNALTGV